MSALIVSIFALAGAAAIYAARPMPRLIRVALMAPRIALALLYFGYYFASPDAAVRTDATRAMLVASSIVEIASAVISRWAWQRGLDYGGVHN